MSEMPEQILIVEDDEALSTELEDSLLASGYGIAGHARSAQAAVQLASARHPDLVLMDVALRGPMDGVDAAKVLRQTSSSPIVFLTGHADHRTVARAKEVAPNGFLVKPFSARELAITIELALYRSKMERSIESERERLAVTLRCIGEGVIATDSRACVALLNAVAESLTGWSQKDAMGRPVGEVFKVVAPDASTLTRDRLDSTSAKELPLVLIAKDGSQRLISQVRSPMLDGAQRAVGEVLVFRDVSKQLSIEREMLRAQKLEAIGLLAGGIAHDFNNLLGIIALNISYAAQSTEPVTPILEDVLSACARAASLTQQLLTFAGGDTLVRRARPLGDMLKATAEFALRGSMSRCIADVSANLWPAEVDEGQIEQVLTNLVINAHESMPQGGNVEIRASNRTVADGELACPAGRYVQISITDHGTGIEPQLLDRIFEPYFSTKNRGSGLGLATSYAIAQRHGGLLAVKSTHGAGATFELLLPAARAETPTAGHQPSSPVDLRGRRGRILVMDDERSLRRTVANILSSAGHEVEQAEDGLGAIRLFQEARTRGQPFDFVFLDLLVPGGMGGVQTVKELLAIDPDLHAIATTGYSPDPVLHDPRQFGFVAAIAKPYDARALLELFDRVQQSGLAQGAS